MSAYVQSHRHIDYLVDAAKHYDISWYAGRARDLDHDELGSILVTEQLASVSHRYPADKLEDLPGYVADLTSEYSHQVTGYLLGMEPIKILAAVEGYEYQSCEHPGWATSEAKQIVEVLKEYAIAALITEAGVGSRFRSIDDETLTAKV